MNINHESELPLVNLEALVPGDAFLFNNELYIKTNFSAGRDCIACVVLRDGDCVNINVSNKVQPAQVTVHVHGQRVGDTD